MNSRILLADDEEVICDLFQRALHSMGHSVVTARDGREALALFRRDPDQWNAVILDCVMPESSGEETLREMRALRPNLPALLLSGYAEKGMDGTADHFGRCLFVSKPATIDHVVGKLEELLKLAAESVP